MVIFKEAGHFETKTICVIVSNDWVVALIDLTVFKV